MIKPVHHSEPVPAKASRRERQPRIPRGMRRKLRAYAASDDDDAVPENIDVFRYEIARRIAVYISEISGNWRGCPMRMCRRHHRCMTPCSPCANAPPLPPMSEEEAAQARAKVARALQDAMARHDGARRPEEG